ncbi:MAG: hypothetical protein B0A82_20870 [Alkalinema sp. CACIAM 70d]|uniref:DUF6887 family protein n=1 Tax=Alkalinema pantanalense TaxID=1620705 RepID=UPI000B6CF12D|nr:MAG: hypothetical protein B0A82_20870 [Alkalinema sp. CACIAM 70d]
MKPNFTTMSRAALKSYLLSHRNDADAMSAYIQKISAEPGWVECSALNSPDDLDNYPEFLEKVRRAGQ